jgi:Pectate lyase superfamily protein
MTTMHNNQCNTYLFEENFMKNIRFLSLAMTLLTSNVAFASVCAPTPTSSLVVNVKEFGATGNGVTNDTASIQEAINEVGGTGGTVYVPDGTYRIDAVTSLNLKSNMTFRMMYGAILKAIPNNNGGQFHIIRMDNVTNVNVVGGTVKGERASHLGTTGEWGKGVGLYGANNVVIEDVTSKDNWGDGFYVSDHSTNSKFCSVVADNNRRLGVCRA